MRASCSAAVSGESRKFIRCGHGHPPGPDFHSPQPPAFNSTAICRSCSTSSNLILLPKEPSGRQIRASRLLVPPASLGNLLGPELKDWSPNSSRRPPTQVVDAKGPAPLPASSSVPAPPTDRRVQKDSIVASGNRTTVTQSRNPRIAIATLPFHSQLLSIHQRMLAPILAPVGTGIPLPRRNSSTAKRNSITKGRVAALPIWPTRKIFPASGSSPPEMRIPCS
jgi:hypothetical protein